MPKVKRKRIGDIGIRLKPIETNLLENYNEFSNRRNKTRNKKKERKPKNLNALLLKVLKYMIK